MIKIILTALFLSLMFGQLNAQTEQLTVSQNTSPSSSSADFTVSKNLDFRQFAHNKLEAAPDFVLPSKNIGKQNLSKQTAWKYVRPTARVRLKKYLNRSFGVYGLIGAGAGATVGQITDSPEEWENNAKGFARRFASSYARNIIQESIVFGLDETFRVDSRFYKKGKSEKFKTRLANALLSGVTARSKSGKRIPGFSRLVGTYTSSVIATETWFPDRFSYQDGLRQGTYSLGFNVGLNLLREFVSK